jgi:hypothetical protein
MPDSWYDNTEWAGPEIALKYAVVQQPVHGGSRSLRIDVDGGFAQFTQWRDLPPGAAYRLSLCVRAQPKAAAAAAAVEGGLLAVGDDAEKAAAEQAAAAGDAGGMAVTLGLRLADSPYTMFDSVSAQVGSSWTQLVVPAAVIPYSTAADNPDQTVSVGFMVNTGGLGSLWLDDASLTVEVSLPEVTVITNKAAVVTRQYFCMNVNHMGGREHDWKPGYTWPVVDFGLYRTVSSSSSSSSSSSGFHDLLQFVVLAEPLAIQDGDEALAAAAVASLRSVTACWLVAC